MNLLDVLVQKNILKADVAAKIDTEAQATDKTIEELLKQSNAFWDYWLS